MGEDDEGRPNGIVRDCRREDYNPERGGKGGCWGSERRAMRVASDFI